MAQGADVVQADWALELQLQDTAEQAEEEEFEDRFRLFQDGRPGESNRHFVAGLLHNISLFVRPG